MFNWLISLSILLMAVLPFQAIAKDACTSYYKKQLTPSISPSLDDNLYAVHLTDFFPNDGILKTTMENKARFATTLHFSLGAPVISHSAGNWENKKYGILIPFKFLKPQLLNIFFQDTFIIGDLKLPKEAILLAPMGQTYPQNFPGNIVYYNTNSNIAELVKSQLKKINSIVLEPTGPLPSDKVYFQNNEVNEKTFFNSYFRINKDINRELHSETVFGKLDIGVLNFFANWYYRKKPSTWTLSEIKYHKLVFEESLLFINAKIKDMQLSSIASASYQANLKKLRGLLNIIDIEIQIQETNQRSILSIVEPHQIEILNRMQDKQNLAEYVMKNLESFPVILKSHSETDHFILMATSDLNFLSYERFKVLTIQKSKENPTKKFAYKFLLLKKSIDSIPLNKKYLNIAIGEFEKIIENFPQKSIYQIIDLLKNVDPNQRLLFFRNKNVKSIFIELAGEQNLLKLLNYNLPNL